MDLKNHDKIREKYICLSTFAGGFLELKVKGASKMKKIQTVLLFMCTIGSANLSWADVSSRCERTATTAVEKEFQSYFFENGERIRQVDLVDCEQKLSQRGTYYQSCEVGASNGDGAGDVSFRALLSNDCKRSFSAFITGEE